MADPTPNPSPEPQQCPMCKAMVDHADPEKVKQFMANNPFNK